MSEVNIPLLRKAVEWAEAEHESGSGGWYQPLWVSKNRTNAACGTAYCIAGFVAAQSGWTDDEIRQSGARVADFAAAALGISSFWRPEIDEHLFDGSNDISDVRRIAESLAGERL